MQCICTCLSRCASLVCNVSIWPESTVVHACLTELPLGYFVCFLMLQSLINQTQPEELFSNCENGLGDCGTLRALSTAWFVMLHMIQEI